MFWRSGREANDRRISNRVEKPHTVRPAKAIEILIELRGKANLTAFQFARITRLDYSYWKRLESGESQNLGHDLLLQAARALVGYSKIFDEDDVDRVLEAAGFPPAPDPTLRQMCASCQRRIY